MRISVFTRLFAALLMLLLFAIGIMVFQTLDIRNDIALSQDHRYRSLLLAGELFQTSEDLTRMARAYVITGKPVYKRHFFDIIDIREGIKRRPPSYPNTYWHLVDGEKDPAIKLNAPVSLFELMRKENLDEQETALIREAKISSDKLAELEKQAMGAVDGRYEAGRGSSVIHGLRERESAIDLLFGKSYSAEKAKIMTPIQKFADLIDIRTQAKVNAGQARLDRHILIIMTLIITALLAIAASIFHTRRAILRPLALLRNQAINIRQANYATRCHIDTHNELAELGVAFNSMASAIEQDIATRKAVEESMRQANTIFENSSEAMMVTDTENVIVSVNPAFTKVTGYMPGEVLGKNSSILNADLQREPFLLAVRTSLETTGRWEGQMTGRRKNKEFYIEWRRTNAIHNPDGSVKGWVTLFSDITLQKKSEELVWRQTNFDSLTSLPNRHMFHNRLEQEIKKANRNGASIALIFLDLDNFKEVNDAYGHNSGDLLLKEAAWRLSSSVRGIDTVARLGGDEFSVILGPLKNLISINRVVRDILRKMAEPFKVGDEVAYVSASIGVTFYPQDAIEMEALVRNADQAMYAAKNRGRNCFSYFTHTLHEAAQIRMRLAGDLRGALAGDQLQLHYQPIVELSTGQIHKAEALLRWHHPKLGLVNPSDFISIAEETRMIVDIGDWVFRTAVQQTRVWRALHAAQFQISINTSPVQFRKDADLRKSWLGFLQEMELPGQSVVIEITEGLLMDASPHVTSTLCSLRDAGIQVSMDDFGTGYSSLGYLKKFDIDYLKIDQTFVQNLGPDSDDLALCEAIIVMAHKLGIKVIAEGIETAEQHDLLALAGCDYGQGNLFSKAVPADRFEKLMTERPKWPTYPCGLQLRIPDVNEY
ncbi:bifunctional diguanylate cyclase/phosphodiesterase [Nitrosovibrio sp. Nv6]|uniref:putative bifunctional diguanylate cyclase/phosphodiesterase n=1 Tax=Nitrosovibrio sp. Nv6 TaxID=1855340 RepID=UPI0008AC48F7|nr:EAL domain-containing protein [Nitrosovibrio sp. Nv6]SEP27838.1 PAS domain S-box-containing protein/diguanylate cyclase (GGDEF) domain-containing protein [Nitrosovibrio sp. Nv6]